MNDSDRDTLPRVASVILVLGLVIFVVSLGVLAYGERDVRRASESAGTAADGSSPAVVGAVWLRAVFWLAILLFAFVIALSAFLRWSRRYRQKLFRHRSEPTEYADAWSMHRLPDDAVDDDDAGEPPDRP